MQFQQFMLNYEAHVVKRHHLWSAVEKRSGAQHLSGVEIIKEEATSLPKEFTEAPSIENIPSAHGNTFNTVQHYLYSLALSEL